MMGFLATYFHTVCRKPRVSILCQNQARAAKVAWKRAIWVRQKKHEHKSLISFCSKPKFIQEPHILTGEYVHTVKKLSVSQLQAQNQHRAASEITCPTRGSTRVSLQHYSNTQRPSLSTQVFCYRDMQCSYVGMC